MTDIVLKDLDPGLLDRLQRLAEGQGWPTFPGRRVVAARSGMSTVVRSGSKPASARTGSESVKSRGISVQRMGHSLT